MCVSVCVRAHRHRQIVYLRSTTTALYLEIAKAERLAVPQQLRGCR